MPADVHRRTADLRMLHSESRVSRHQLSTMRGDKSVLMDRIKQEIIDRMLRQIGRELEQVVSIEHYFDHAADMEVWRGRVLLAMESVNALRNSPVVHYLDENGAPWITGGGITVPGEGHPLSGVMLPTRAPDLVAAKKREPKPEPKFTPDELDSLEENAAGSW